MVFFCLVRVRPPRPGPFYGTLPLSAGSSSVLAGARVAGALMGGARVERSDTWEGARSCPGTLDALPKC